MSLEAFLRGGISRYPVQKRGHSEIFMADPADSHEAGALRGVCIKIGPVFHHYG